MTEPTKLHRIDDFALPRLPLALQGVNLLARHAAKGLIPFNVEELMNRASRREGQGDFGDLSFLHPLKILVESIDREGGVSPSGRLLVRELLTGLLTTRLRLQALLDRHPEIRDEPVEAPIFVVGLPRTGTTHLHNLLCQDRALRYMPYWEGLEPIPALDQLERRPKGPDPRVKRCDQALKLTHWVMPMLPMMHEITSDSAHEEIQLQAASFRSMLFEVTWTVPSYRDWYTSHDQTPAYREMRTLLQAMQWLRGPRRWLLKSPSHLEQLGPLFEVFPDAKLIWTHRDPVTCTASMCALVGYGLRMHREEVDTLAVGRYWADRLEAMLKAAVRDRPLVPDGQILDLQFGELISDDLAMVRRIYEFTGQTLSGEALAAIEAFKESHPPGRHGSIRYEPGDFGLDPAERRRALSFYQEAFDVAKERLRDREAMLEGGQAA